MYLKWNWIERIESLFIFEIALHIFQNIRFFFFIVINLKKKMIEIVHFSSISSMLCKCVYEKCLFHSKRPKNYCIYIFERYNATMVLYTRWDRHTRSTIDTTTATQHQRQYRMKIKDNREKWRQTKKKKRYKKKF